MFQLWPTSHNFSKNACQMNYFPLNGDQCKSLHFPTKSSSTRNILGDIQIGTYIYNYAVLFNVSFHDIKWNCKEILNYYLLLS